MRAWRLTSVVDTVPCNTLHVLYYHLLRVRVGDCVIIRQVVLSPFLHVWKGSPVNSVTRRTGGGRGGEIFTNFFALRMPKYTENSDF